MSRPDKATTEKAELQILSMIEASYKPRDQRDLAEWIVSAFPAAMVEGLAADWDDSQADAPRPWIIKSNELGTADYWSNSDGWTHYINTADRFTDAEKQTLTLPAGGDWVRMEGGRA